VEFIDLKAQQGRIRDKIDAGIKKVLDHGQYIMGPEVLELEQKLCEFTGAKHCISCGNGTDALVLALKAYGLVEGDVVFVPAFTFSATAEAVVLAGGIPYFVDVDERSFNLCPKSLADGISDAAGQGYNLAGVIVVGLFGNPPSFDEITPVCEQNDLFLVDDAAQSLGSSYKGKMTGTLGDITTTSFFPSKPLGCYGDGGALFTDSADIAELLESLRVHGKGKDKYDNVRIGTNSRLDTLQAAVLLAKLDLFEDELEVRRSVASKYEEYISGIYRTQTIEEFHLSAWAQYSLVSVERPALLQKLGSEGIPYSTYYPATMNQQKAYSMYPHCSLERSEALARTIFQIPFHPYLTESSIGDIAKVLAA
jgi:dTDP-4-amino-4,6-dideoxygalactose transaminase